MASQAALDLIVRLQDQASGELDKLAGTVDDVGTKGGFLKDAFSFATGGLIAGGIATVTSGLAGMFTGAISDAREAAAVMAQTEAVITSTGGAAGFTAEEVSEMAGSLSDAAGVSMFSGEQVQEGQNLLLTFTNIKETLPDATQTMVDMAAALGTDVSGGAVQLGKALNDPIAGISALSRVGVTFTDQQKEQIRVMTEAGDTAGAQRLILEELNKEFGGSAAAAAQADGGIAMLQARVGDAAKEFGFALLPAIASVTELLSGPGFIGAIESLLVGFAALVSGGVEAFIMLQQNIDPLMPIFAGVAAAVLTVVVPSFVAWATAAYATAAANIAALAPILIPVAAIGAAVALLYYAWQNNFGGIRDITTAVWSAIVSATAPVMAALQRFWTEIQPQLLAAWNTIRAGVTAAVTALQAIIVAVVGIITTSLTTHASTIQTVVSGAWTAIQGIVKVATSILSGAIRASLLLIQGDWRGAWDAMKTAAQSVLDGLQSAVSGALTAIGGIIRGAAGALLNAAISIGTAIIDGIKNGISAGVGALSGMVENAARSALDAAKRLLGIRSPSQVFADEVGVPMMEGLGEGVTEREQELTQKMVETIEAAMDKMIGMMESKLEELIDAVRSSFAQLEALPAPRIAGPIIGAPRYEGRDAPPEYRPGVDDSFAPGSQPAGRYAGRDAPPDYRSGVDDAFAPGSQPEAVPTGAPVSLPSNPIPVMSGNSAGTVIYVDARGSGDPAAVEAAAHHGAEAALMESGRAADARLRLH